ncbi:hypothetical protein KI688_008006 [Linnemannia hyalina]|uniref:Uncharacterized protein n=1 Tax=Linnemannia hyalina TaxID=64524 RepID=A0A9P7Y002_9FUNG|nr:hypothetical protein KI688_008006 [Linnemannia hyalina]
MLITPKLNPAEVALSLPEVLDVLASSCYPREDGTVVEKDEKWLRAILAKNGRYIRHLNMTWIALLLNAGAAGSTITRLRSLSAYHFSMGLLFEEEAPLYDLPVLAGQQAVISSYILSPAFEDALEPTPNIRFNRLNGMAFKIEAMINTMQSLSKLTRLKNVIMHRPLQKILGKLPGLQHYTYCSPISSGRYFFPNDLELDQAIPRLLSLEILSHRPLRLASLLNLLEFLPSLEQLTISAFLPASRYFSGLQMEESIASMQESLSNKSHSRLHIVKEDHEITAALDETIAGIVLPVIPFLAEITLRVLLPATVVALVEHCLHLETVKAVDDVCSNKVKVTLPENVPLVPLHGYPTLKHLDAACHSVDSRLLLEKPIVCRELETFLLSKDEKRRVIVKHKASQDLHHQIYATFSGLTNLHRLDFGHDLHVSGRHRDHWLPMDQVFVPETILVAGRVYHTMYPPNRTTLKLSLDAGLDPLRTLSRLKVFGFRGVDHRVGKEELDWMATAWPRLERVLGVGDDFCI